MIVNKSTIIIIIVTMLTTMSRSIISILQPVSWPLASQSSRQVAREQRRPDNAFARTPSPTVVVVVLFLFLNFEYMFAQIPYPTVIVVVVFYLFLLFNLFWLWSSKNQYLPFLQSLLFKCFSLFLLFAISFVSIFAFVFVFLHLQPAQFAHSWKTSGFVATSVSTWA